MFKSWLLTKFPATGLPPAAFEELELPEDEEEEL
jgi:hypothetical protein